MAKTERTEAEIARVEKWAAEGIRKGSRKPGEQGSRYPGMSYEQGIIDALDWVTGLTYTAPDEKD
jgi:hypothetical protein